MALEAKALSLCLWRLKRCFSDDFSGTFPCISVRKDARKRKNARQGERVPKRRRHCNDIFEPYRPAIVEDDLEGEAVDNIILLLEEDGVREIYRNHWTSLRTHYREGPNHSHYPFRWDSQTEPSWEQWLSSVFSRQEKRFKFNISHSFVLYNREADEFRFFHASKNNARVWDKPKTICRFRDINMIVGDLKAVDTLEYARQQRPNTKWTVHSVTSTTFYVDKLPDLPIGGCCCKTRRSSLSSSTQTIINCVMTSFAFFDAWQLIRQVHVDVLKRVFELYFVNGLTLAHAFGCEKCGKQYKERKKLIWHEKRCAGEEINRYYPGGVYHPNPTPLEVLADEGVPVETDFVYPFRATYDFECYFTKSDIPTASAVKTSYTARHVPLSVSVCSNVPGFENPKCLISDGDPQSLVDRMGDYLEEISTSAFQILRDTCFKDAFEYLETLREEDDKGRVNLKTTLLKYLSQLPVVGFNSGKYDLNVIKPYFAQRFLISEVDDYESDSECGNSLRQWGKRFVIKKNNEFMAINTPFLKFLDITNFTAPGFSYAKYLAAYEVEEQKGFFPYEYITSIEKLDVWFLYIASPQQGDLRLSGPPSGQGAGGGARTRNRKVPADLRADSLATVPPTPPRNSMRQAYLPEMLFIAPYATLSFPYKTMTMFVRFGKKVV
ncbi:hypothetical protein PoB_002173000 [Plakobranchus ocellatus]|uniref:C2H2-type domain-containing protein n=1 Tax=Plakobranchus ocellatus TaxID=259542 RepID=A0AAV3ZHW3_9GAST|nr:hypothetical protein PoB_002173000 [Plakobranchus ocellatus]